MSLSSVGVVMMHGKHSSESTSSIWLPLEYCLKSTRWLQGRILDCKRGGTQVQVVAEVGVEIVYHAHFHHRDRTNVDDIVSVITATGFYSYSTVIMTASI